MLPGGLQSGRGRWVAEHLDQGRLGQPAPSECQEVPRCVGAKRQPAGQSQPVGEAQLTCGEHNAGELAEQSCCRVRVGPYCLEGTLKFFGGETR